MTGDLERLSEDLREALRIQDLTLARSLLMAYRAEFDRLWTAMSEAERKQSPLPRQALDLLNWARTMAVATRQEIGDRCKSLGRARKYAGPAGPRPGIRV